MCCYPVDLPGHVPKYAGEDGEEVERVSSARLNYWRERAANGDLCNRWDDGAGEVREAAPAFSVPHWDIS